MFETIVESSGRTGSRKTVLISLTLHTLVLGVLIVVPLIYYQSLPGGWELLADVFAAPPPDPVPPTPPPVPSAVSARRVHPEGPVVVLVPDLIEPSKVPAPPDAVEIEGFSHLIGPAGTGEAEPFVPGFVGPTALVPNVVRPAGPRVPPPPPPRQPRQPVLMSVLDPSRLIHRVEPVYPQIAIQARVSGSVMLQVTVNEMGIVESVEVVRGHPLLNAAAIQAVSQWRYKPTILNGEPIPVKATVTVNFNLQHR